LLPQCWVDVGSQRATKSHLELGNIGSVVCPLRLRHVRTVGPPGRTSMSFACVKYIRRTPS
jgi:hypothetical protein